MGIPEIPPILRGTADFTHGANFAIADATVLGSPPETVSFFILSLNSNCVPVVIYQVGISKKLT